MSSTNSDCTPVIPPGVKLSNVNFNPLFDKIVFPNPRPTTPFEPLVQSYYNEGTLEVSAVLLINSEANVPIIDVFFDSNTMSFYFAYNAPENPSSSFNAFQVTVSVPLGNKPSVITSYLVDEDPVGSRGTETTVQPV